MIPKKNPAALGLLLAALALPAGAVASDGGAPAEQVRNHFDADGPMRPPGFFDLVVLGAPGEARWLVLTDPNPPSTANRLAQVKASRPADSIAAAVRRTYTFQDGTVSVFVKRGASRAGILLRYADEKNFLVLLADTATGEAVLSSYRGGRATELGRGRAALDREWEKVAVSAAGPSLNVVFGETKLFEAVDPKPVSGRAGLAAAGPGEASFDELVLDIADAR